MKTLKHSPLALLVAACFSGAAAAPTLPQVVNGQASFSQQGNVFSITNTPNTIINWQSFSVNPGEVTRFIQQGDSSAVLNRILGQDPSQILGALQSNGRVFLINPNGILFGRDSRVDVNGLVASTLNLSNADFLAGKKNFAAGATAGNVSNQGAITTASGGQVFLIAPNVENTGIITSPKGEVVLAAGHTVQLVDSGNPDLHVVVSAPASRAINLGQVIAHGGTVGIYGALINQRGTVNANSAVVGENGKIVFKASGDTLLEAGSVTSATGAGKGGEIHILGERVGLTGDAQVDASGNAGGGTVLIGGDYQGKNAAIQNAQQVFIDQDVVVNADARQGGDGGKVIAWSDGITRAYGTISARGGAGGGNGGFVETSGKYLAMQGRVDTRAPLGKTGMLLLDPTDIYIANTQANATAKGMVGLDTSVNAGTFLAIGSVFDSLLTVGTLQTALGSSSVTVQTVNALGSGVGNIMVVDPISWTSASQLTLSADSSIFVNAGITGTSGVLSLRAYGGSITQTAPIKASGLLAYADVGTVALSTASNQVTTLAGYTGTNSTGFTFVNGGALTVGTVAGSNGIRTNNAAPVSLNTSAGNLEMNNLMYGIDAAGGVVTLNAQTGNVLVSGPIKTAGSGTVTLSGGGSSGVSMSGTGSISTAGGALSITASASEASFAMGANTKISTAGGQIAITADKMTLGGTAAGGAINSGSGVVSLSPQTAANIWLGAAGTDLTASTLELSSTELNSIATSLLRVGSSGVGNIDIRNPLTNGVGGAFEHLSGTSTLALNTNTLSGSITQTTPGATIGGVSQLSLAGNRVELSQSNPTGVVSGVTTGGFQFRSANQVTLGYVDGIHGITAGSESTVVLTSDNDGISQLSGNALRAPAGIVVLDAAGPAVLTESGNQFRFLAAALNFRAPGPSAIYTAGDMSITNTVVGATTYNGVATNNQNLQLTSPGSIWLAAPIVTTGAVALTAGAANSPNVSNVVTFESTVTAGGGLTVNANQVAGSLAPVAGPGVVLNVVGAAPPPPPPTVAACIANPSLSGCSAVLPTLAQCISQPTVAGCSAILPNLSACVSSPTTAGCSVVLPSLATCVGSPATAGCSVVLPSLATCVGSPTTAGCSAVLPTLAACIAAPTSAGCSVVLPTLPSCVANPTTAGCVVILPGLATCIGNPSFAGCSVVLPTMAACIVTPTTAGCMVVLPTLPQCTSAPAAQGCSVVLPKLAACIAAPATAGCSVVLPTLTQCVATPTAPGCAVVLPTLDQCAASPTLQGCSVVLPTLAQCATTPAQAGCKAVLPTASFCSTHPKDAACVAVTPPSAPEEGKGKTPIGQALNTTVALINTKPPETTTTGGGADTSTRGAGTDSKGKPNTGPSAGNNTGANSDAPNKKMYCN